MDGVEAGKVYLDEKACRETGRLVSLEDVARLIFRIAHEMGYEQGQVDAIKAFAQEGTK